MSGSALCWLVSHDFCPSDCFVNLPLQVGKPQETPRARKEAGEAGRLQGERGDGQDGGLSEGHPHVPADEHPPQLLCLETPSANARASDCLEPEG